MLAGSRGLSSTSAIRLAVRRASSSLNPRVVMAGGADAHTAGDHGLFRIVRYGVLVDGHVGAAQHGLGFLAGDALGAQVDQHDVAFGATADDAQTALGQGFSHDLCVFQHLLLVRLEFGLQRFFESHGLGGDDVHQRAALQTREDRAVDGLFVLGLHQDDATARAAQALVRGGGHHVGERYRVGVHARGDQAGVVAMSTMKMAPTSLAIFAKRSKSMRRL